jgi:hypothetical protein
MQASFAFFTYAETRKHDGLTTSCSTPPSPPRQRSGCRFIRERTLGIEIPVWEAAPTVQGTESRVISFCCLCVVIMFFRPLDGRHSLPDGYFNAWIKNHNSEQMITFLRRWRNVLLCLPAALVLGAALRIWVASFSFHSLDVLISDHTPFEYDHNLPRGYDSNIIGRLETMQAAAVTYAQNHKGHLPPMENADMTLNAIKPYLGIGSEWSSQNPATAIRFTPNAALSGRKLGASGRNAVLFYDANPPKGYRESYYVTVIGRVGHVSVADLSKLLQQQETIKR